MTRLAFYTLGMYILSRQRCLAAAAFAALSATTGAVCAQQTPAKDATVSVKIAPPVGYDDTPYLPGGKWRVHDSKRPQPTVVTPPLGSQGTPATPPADATVLFDGKDMSKWQSGNGGPISWKVVDGAMEVVGGAGGITTRQQFGDCQLHVEWRTPTPPRGDSQGRSNSGIFLMNVYEIQVLDCYNNPTYADGTAGAVYGQTPPLVNATRKPGEWQTYDIFFNAPVYDGNKLTKPGYVTIVLNGVLVQNHTEILGQTNHRTLPGNKPHGPTGPISLQDHGDPIRFRNIWIRPLNPIP